MTLAFPKPERPERGTATAKRYLSLVASPERIRLVLRLDPETGELFWNARDEAESSRVRQWNAAHAGKRALCTPKGDGYLHGSIDGRLYATHRVVFAHYYGRWPLAEIDHINRIRSDNRVSNLREATPQQNKMNTHHANKHGAKGICYAPSRGKWIATITHNYRRYWLGSFTTREEAAQAYAEAAQKHFGEFAS